MSWDLEPPKQNELQATPQPMSNGWDSAPPTELEIQRQPQQAPEKSFKDKALDAAVYVGEKIDQYTGAPTRSAVNALVEGENPLTAFKNQFGENPNLAPTGKQIAQKVGVPDTSLSDVAPGMFTADDKEAQSWLKFKKGGAADISASGAAGLGLDLVADPTLVVPVGAIAKGTASAGLKGLKGAAMTAKESIAASKPIAQATQIAKTGATKLAHGLTGVPVRNIEVYAKNTDQINNMIKKYGGDVTLMADDTRAGFNKAIESTKAGLNKTIETALESAPTQKNIDISWVRESIDAAKSKVNPTLNPEVIKELDDLYVKASNVADGWKVNAKDLNDLKKYTQDLAKGSYKKDGQIFVMSGEASRAAKDVAAKLRKQLNTVSPEVAKANNTLSRLHGLDEKINKNLLGVGKSESALINAGAGTNKRATRQIEELGKITGKDFIGEAEKLSAAQTFSKTPIMPMDTTGKSAARMAVGYAIGGIPGIALTSPLTLKAAINAKQIPQSVIGAFSRGVKSAEKNADQLFAKMNTPAGKRIIEEISRGSRVASIGKGRPAAQSSEGDTSIASYKGENKWAIDGYANLLGQDPAFEDDKFFESAMSNPKAKMLLAQASELTPGSKAMMSVIQQLKQIQGAK